MADEPKRIIDLTEVSSVAAGDYLAMDSEDGGTKKVKASYFTGGSENYMWGAIQGDIEDQTDLATRLNAIEETLPNKADIDGYYEDMSVGSAEQLLSNTYENDSTPYLYRTSGGSLEIGDRVYEDAIVGASFSVNQLVDKSKFISSSSSGVTLTPNGDGSITVTIENDLTSDVTLFFTANNSGSYIKIPAGHQYIVYSKTTRIGLGSFQNGYSGTSLGWNWIYTASSNVTILLGFKFSSGTTAGTYTIIPQITDLTLMFGSAIADYANSLPSGKLPWFNSYGFFLKDYYPYNAGGIESVKTSAKKVVGFNQFDKSKAVANSRWSGATTASYPGNTRSDYIPCFPNTTYYFKNVRGMSIMTPIYWYDANKEYISANSIGSPDPSSGTATSPANAYYMGINFPSSYIDTVCVNIHWDGERDGEYEAYEEHTYPLGNDELRGLYTLSNGKIVANGDVKTSDGQITRKYSAPLDLGTLDWVKITDTHGDFFQGTYLSRTNASALLSQKYVTKLNPYANDTDMIYFVFNINSSNGAILIRDSSYTDAATFKTAMSGVYLVYGLETPITESADPYTNPQLVDNWGTEEFVDTRDVPVPVGHDSRYLPDLKAKLESAPNNPSTNGKYFLQYENGQAIYVPVPSEVPEAPSEDGTYVLKATVSGGTATLSWVAEE